MLGYDIDAFIADFAMEVPNHNKIDVDGIELAIVDRAFDEGWIVPWPPASRWCPSPARNTAWSCSGRWPRTWRW